MDIDAIEFVYNENDDRILATQYGPAKLNLLNPEDLSPEDAPLYMEVEDDKINGFRPSETSLEDVCDVMREFYNETKFTEQSHPMHISASQKRWEEGLEEFTDNGDQTFERSTVVFDEGTQMPEPQTNRYATDNF